MPSYVLKLLCADRPGIVHALAAGVLDVGGNISESAQFSDAGAGTFCVRTVFDTPEADVDPVYRTIADRLDPFDPELTLRPEAQRRRVVLMVSKIDHCLVDLLYRWQIGELPVAIDSVVSNHPDCRPIAERYGLEYRWRPVTPATRAEAEADLLAHMAERGVDFVVLARYMQVLSDDLCRRLAGRIINIHHSFLPGFVGARPYHQAYARGVKMIGATAHYVTADLDEGPIIEQDVVRVSHGHTPADLAVIGRDVERRVLARAVRLHAEDRIVLAGTRTVVFA